MALTAPPADEVLNFQFKLHCRLKIFENEDNAVFGKPCSLIAAASRYGLVFVGGASPCFQVLSLDNIEQISEKKADIRDYLKRIVDVPSLPSHLSVNCDCTLLCVVVEKESCATALIYNIASFATQNVAVAKEVRLSATPGVFVVEVSWNPTIPAVLTVCKSDKSLALYEFKGTSIDINEIPPNSGSTSMCWSPKGKQLAVGSADGKITQYKPDLKPVKSINAPQLANGCSVLALQWVSNYQFIAIYGSTEPESRANLVVVDAPKTGETKYINYEDICYSYGSTRPVQFYMILQPTWNVLFVASSNSMEVGILGLSKEQQWSQWILGDAARAELPLSAKKQDTLPVGLCIDIGTKANTPWGENTLPPSPFLYLLSHHGVLCCFHIVNIREGAAQICQAPEILPENNGLKYFTKESVAEKKQDTSVPKIVQQQAQPPQQQPIQTQPQQQLQQQQTSFFSPKSKDQPLFGSSTKPLFNTPQQPFPISTNVFNSPRQNIPAPQISTPQTIKVEVKPAVPTPTTVENVPAVPKIDVETEKLIAKMIREECISLESELKALLHRAQSLKISLGTDAESTELVRNTEDFQIFLEKMTETSTGQAAEIHTLKQKLLQSWACVEDARSRFAISKDPTMAALIRTQPLDPASQQYLDDITHLLYYIESQLTQANNTLDEQWENFQDSCKKTYKLQMPTMETIYQAMVRQTATVQKQNYILKDIAARLRKHNSRNSSVALLASLENADEVVNKLKGLQLQPQDLIQVEYERVLKKQKQLSQEKRQKLQEYLGEHQPRIIKIVKPQIAPLKLTPQKSILEANVSPVVSRAKEPTARVLDFMQSTPKPTSVNIRYGLEGIESKPAFSSSAFAAATTQPLFSASKPAFVVTTVSQSANSLFSSFDTKSAFNFAPAITTSVSPSKFSFTTIPTTVSAISANTIFSGFKYPTSNVPATQMSIFDAGAKTVVSSPGIIKPMPKAAVAPLTHFTAQPQDVSKGFSFMHTTQASTVASQGSLFAKPTVAFGNKAFGVDTATSGVSVSQNQNTIFNFSTSKAASTATVSQAPLALVTKPTTTLSAQPLMFATTTTVQSSITSLATTISGGSGINYQSSLFSSKSTLPLAITTTTSAFDVSSTLAATTSTTSIFAQTPVTTSIVSATSSLVSSASVFSVAAASLTTSAITTSATITTSVFSPASILTTTTPTSIVCAPLTPTTPTSKFSATPVPITPTSIFSTETVPTTPTTIFATTTAPATPISIFSTGAVQSTPTSTSSSATVPTTPTSISSAVPVSTTATVSTFVTVPITSVTSTVTSPATISADSTIASTGSLFGTIPAATTTPSIFGAALPTATFSAAQTAVPSKPSIFGAINLATTAATLISSVVTTSAVNSVFGTGTTSVPDAATAVTAATSPNFFGSASTVATSSIFGTVPTATTSNAPSNIFGTVPTTTTNSGFGTGTTAAVTRSLFGTAPSATSGSGFGTTAPTTATGSIFGTPTTTASSTFGTPTTGSIFGSTSQQPPVATTTSSVFGATATTSIFGAAPATTGGSIFGGTSAFGSTAFGQKPSVFGSTTSTNPPAFGSAPVFASTAPAFGTTTTSQTNFGSGSLFGTPVSSSGSIFGGAQSGSSIFGKSATTPPGFGSPATSTSSFGSGSGFSFANANTPTTSSTYGFSKPAGSFGGDTSSFSFGSLNVGTTTSTSTGFGSGFGQTQAANPFGRTDASKPAFGSSNGSIFGSPAATSFGSTSTFGSPTFGGTPTFGSTPGFGQSNFGQSGFGSPPFGSPSQPSGPFSAGGQSVGQTGFGAGAFQSSPGGFGGPPVFGSGSFGASPTFGQSPGFGSAPAFGSTNLSSNAFGSPSAQQNPTFGNLATQNTLGFGSLAQQTQAQPTQQPAFGGGSSFSSWR